MSREPLLIAEMIEAAERAVELVGDRTSGEVRADQLRMEALLWNFTVLGEAASQMPAGFREAHAHIEWADPVRLRNRVVHGYWSVDMDVLVDTAQTDLGSLIETLRQLLAQLGA